MNGRLEPAVRRERKDVGGVDDDRVGDVGDVLPGAIVGTDLETTGEERISNSAGKGTGREIGRKR